MTLAPARRFRGANTTAQRPPIGLLIIASFRSPSIRTTLRYARLSTPPTQRNTVNGPPQSPPERPQLAIAGLWVGKTSRHTVRRQEDAKNIPAPGQTKV